MGALAEMIVYVALPFVNTNPKAAPMLNPETSRRKNPGRGVVVQTVEKSRMAFEVSVSDVSVRTGVAISEVVTLWVPPVKKAMADGVRENENVLDVESPPIGCVIPTRAA